MEHMKYWSRETNPETGAKFEHWRVSLKWAHNGEADLDALLDSEYGAKFTEYGDLRFRMEEDPMGEACLAYYRGHGVRKEMYDAEAFYERWTIFTPLDMPAGERYPLIFWNHGGANAIEVDEFAVTLSRDAAREKYIVIMLQNTNWKNLKRVLDIVVKKYPVDEERVYVMGFSQGGQTTCSALLRMPERFAAVAPCGNDAFPSVDNQNVDYTVDELVRLRCKVTPVLQIVGACEKNWLTPHNRWLPPKVWGPNQPRVSLYRHPDGPYELDPTNMGPDVRARRAAPVPGFDPDEWKLTRLNLRLATLGIAPRDIAKCLSYREAGTDELHRELGFYGDREEIRCYYGLKHYVADIDNCDGLPAFRYIAMANSPHYPGVMMGELAWEFFRQFRRDGKTGRVVVDPYRA